MCDGGKLSKNKKPNLRDLENYYNIRVLYDIKNICVWVIVNKIVLFIPTSLEVHCQLRALAKLGLRLDFASFALDWQWYTLQLDR